MPSGLQFGEWGGEGRRWRTSIILLSLLPPFLQMSRAAGDSSNTGIYLPPSQNWRSRNPEDWEQKTLKMSLAGKGNQHLPTCFPHPVSGSRANCPNAALTQGPAMSASGILGDPRVSSIHSQRGHRAHWRWRQSTPPSPWAQCTPLTAFPDFPHPRALRMKAVLSLGGLAMLLLQAPVPAAP